MQYLDKTVAVLEGSSVASEEPMTCLPCCTIDIVAEGDGDLREEEFERADAEEARDDIPVATRPEIARTTAELRQALRKAHSGWEIRHVTPFYAC